METSVIIPTFNGPYSPYSTLAYIQIFGHAKCDSRLGLGK